MWDLIDSLVFGVLFGGVVYGVVFVLARSVVNKAADSMFYSLLHEQSLPSERAATISSNYRIKETEKWNKIAAAIGVCVGAAIVVFHIRF